MITGDSTGHLQIWDSITGNLISVFSQQHSDAIVWMALSPDGTQLASASLDATVKVWDIPSGEQLINILAYPVGTTSTIVAFSPDGTRLATVGDLDETARIWETATGQELFSFSLQRRIVGGIVAIMNSCLVKIMIIYSRLMDVPERLPFLGNK